MARTKAFAEASKSSVQSRNHGMDSHIPHRLIQRAAAHPAQTKVVLHTQATEPRINRSAETVAAVVVDHGKALTTGQLTMVPGGGSVTPESGTIVAGFIHRDGSAVRFMGEGGGIFLGREQAAYEFRALVDAAGKMLHVNATAPIKAPVHRSTDRNTAATPATAVDRAVQSSAAHPLPKHSRTKLEQSYGVDLGSVRLHTDSTADHAAKSVQAHAFTTGQDIFFRSGQFQPNSKAGSHLLAHEVAHTVQQGPQPVTVAKKAVEAGVHFSQPGDRFEIEADSAASAATEGRRASLSPLNRLSGQPPIARKMDSQPTNAPPPALTTPPAPAPTKSTNNAPPTTVTSEKTSAKKAVDPSDSAAKEKNKPADDVKQPDKKKGSEKQSESKTPKSDKDEKKAQEAAGEETAKGQEQAADASNQEGLKSVLDAVSGAGAAQSEHDSPEAKAAETEKATDVTEQEAQGKAKGKQAQELATAKKGKFNKEDFKAALRKKIEELKVENAKEIKEGDQAQGINNAVKSGVAEGKQQAAGDITQKAQQAPPAVDPVKGEPLTPPKIGAPPKIDGAKAVPPPVPESKISMTAETKAVDDQMATANVTPEQLQKANEPSFQAAADAHSATKSEAEALPIKARTEENKLLDSTKAQSKNATEAGVGQMFDQRSDKLQATADKQSDGKAKYEETRKRISEQLGKVYEETKQSVDKRMVELDKQVETAFEEGASAAKRGLYLFIGSRLLVYYATGGFIADAFTGGSTKESIFKEGRDKFQTDMDGVIDQVATIVETGLNDVVAIIAAGKDSLEAVLSKLSPDEAAVGKEVAAGIRDQFAQLEKSVEEKQNQLIDSISQKYVAAQKDVDSTLNALKDPIGAAVSAVKEQIAGVIETIMNLRNMLLNVFAKAAEAIDLIIKDPIGFLGNLINGVGQGIKNFASNIGKYLQKGLLEWLFGAIAQAGIQMPETFDLKGLLSIVLQVLGLTWANIRLRAVAIVGEPTVKALETGAEIFKILITKGAAGIWEYIKEQAAALLETVKEGVKTFVMESVIVAGVKWLIGLLNPASAFVKACMAIYDIVMFIVNRGKQIMDFVNAVLDSVISIARGSIGVAANAVEAALARSVPVAIGFLASLLGVGDLGEKIKKVIDKIQAPVNKMIDWLIKKAVGLVKAVGKLFGVGKNKESQNEDPQADLFDRIGDRAVAAVNATSDAAEIAVETVETEFKTEGLKSLKIKQDSEGRELVEASVNPIKVVAIDNTELGTTGFVVLVANIEADGEISSSVHTQDRGKHYKRNENSEMVLVEEFSTIRRTDERAQPKRSGPSVASTLITKPEEKNRCTIVTRCTLERKMNTGAVRNFQHAEHQFYIALKQKMPALPPITKINIHLTVAPCDQGCVDDITEKLNELLDDKICPKSNRSLIYDKLHNSKDHPTPADFKNNASKVFGSVVGPDPKPAEKQRNKMEKKKQ